MTSLSDQGIHEKASLPSISKKVQRNSTIDIFRTVACFGVIAIHVHASTVAAENVGKTLLSFCVPFFYSTALVYFASGLMRNIDISEILLKIIKRIGIPFLTWSIIYTSLLLIKSKLTGNSYSLNLPRIFMYGESAEHLYYLPELIAIQLLALGTHLIVTNNNCKLALGLLVATISYLAWGSWHNYFGITTTQSIITYLIVGFYLAPNIVKASKNVGYLIVGVILVGLTLTASFIHYPVALNTFLLTIPLGGIGLLLIALNAPAITLPNWLLPVVSATYSIYLSHVVILEALEFLVARKNITIYYDLPTKLFVTLIVFSISILFTLIIRKIKLGRTFLLGES